MTVTTLILSIVFSFRLESNNVLIFIPLNSVLVSLDKFLLGFLICKMGLNMLDSRPYLSHKNVI